MKKNCSMWRCRRAPMIGIREMHSQFCAPHLNLMLRHMPGGKAPLSREEVEQLVARLVEQGLIGVTGYEL